MTGYTSPVIIVSMEFNLADLSRRLQNLIRLGTIAEVKYSRIPRVRVTVGEITTNWLSVVTAHTRAANTWAPRADAG